jgi:hypothetical protein
MNRQWTIKATYKADATRTQEFVAMDGLKPCETEFQALNRVAEFNSYNEFWNYELVQPSLDALQLAEQRIRTLESTLETIKRICRGNL